MPKSSVRARLGQAFARNMNAQEILQNLKPTGEWSEMKGGFIRGRAECLYFGRTGRSDVRGRISIRHKIA